MGELYALGSVAVASDKVAGLERELETLCRATGFPTRTAEFKWSPRRDLWMYGGLTGVARQEFFLAVVDKLAEAEAVVGLCMVDATRGALAWGVEPEEGVVRLFLERADNRLRSMRADGIIVADRPGGAHADDTRFIASCIELIEKGTGFVQPRRIAINVLTTDSKMVRLLQAADLVAGASLAYISGERTYSPPIFEKLLPLYFTASGRRGGVSVKLHPDFTYGNLYHWLFGDTHFWRRNSGFQMPHTGIPYATSPDVY